MNHPSWAEPLEQANARPPCSAGHTRHAAGRRHARRSAQIAVTGPMAGRWTITSAAAVCRGAIERLPRYPLPTDLDAAAHPADIDTGERRAAARVLRGLIRIRVAVADAHDQGSERGLSAHHCVQPFAPPRFAHVGRSAEAHFEREPWDANHHVGAVLQKGIGQREVIVVANQRRAQEASVGVVAPTEMPNGVR